MYTKIILLIYWQVLCLLAHAQMHDNVWLLGYHGGNQSLSNDSFGITMLNFDNNRLTISENLKSNLNLNFTNASFSDSIGKLLLYSNGLYVENSLFRKIPNSDILVSSDWELFGYNLGQGIIFIPSLQNQSECLLLQTVHDYYMNPPWYVEGKDLYYTIINPKKNGNQGAIIKKKVPLLIDTTQYGKLTVVKHANGRDWWVPINKSHSNLYYMFLYDPTGFHLYQKQNIGIEPPEDGGQAVFSPDGSKYVKLNIAYTSYDPYIEIYDFNRCDGTFSNHRRIIFDDNPFAGGVAISRNSRFLYVSSYSNVWQYDLWAQDIASTRTLVAIYDGFVDLFEARFNLAQLAPDGKIYITANNGIRYLHVIHNPDLPYPYCNVEQHGIETPTYITFGTPNFPNYRLGPLDGSPCDTLGFNNIPLSRFRYDQDTLDAFRVDFTNLSDYEPAEWHWDFGDGATSQDTSTVHIFSQPGKYKVCLTVSNQHGSHTSCQTLFIGVSPSENPVLQAQIQVSPNPFRERLSIAFSATNLRQPVFLLYDATGRLVRREPLSLGIHEVETGDLPKGVYFWAVESTGRVGDPAQRVKGGKVLKME